MPRMRRLASLVIVGAVTWSACGDDGNDGALRTRRAEQRAEELRDEEAATSTVPTSTAAAGGPVAVSTTVTSTVPAVEPTGVVVPVVALDNTFRPDVVEIEVGDEVLWENRGLNDHDVLYVDGDDWGIEVEGFGPGAAYAHVFTEPGEYRYYCSIHGNETVGMTGTIIVAG